MITKAFETAFFMKSMDLPTTQKKEKHAWNCHAGFQHDVKYYYYCLELTMRQPNKKQKQDVNHTNAMWKNGRAPVIPVTILTGFLGNVLFCILLCSTTDTR